jgi:hypothetical protein
MTDIGHQCYVQASLFVTLSKKFFDDFSRRKSPGKLYVLVGHGFHVEMTYEESLRFIDRYDKLLQL